SSTQRGMREPTAIRRNRMPASLFRLVLGAALLGALPQALQVVELAGRREHHVDHHVAQVEQRPFAGLQAFGCPGA
ncbi:hypothetical protein Q4S26_21385, partial [Morganella morganii]